MAQEINIRVSILDRATSGLNKLNSSLGSLQKNATQAATKTRSLGTATATSGRTMTDLGSAVSLSNSRLGQFISLSGRASAAIAAFALASLAVKKVGDEFSNAINTASSFERGMLRIAKVTDGFTSDDIPAMTQGLLQISKRSLTAAESLLAIGATAGQLGIPKVEITDFVKVIDKFSVATNATAEASAVAFAKIRSAFKLDGGIEQLERLGSSLNDLENSTPVAAKEIIESLKRVSAAQPLGLAVEDVAAFLTTIQSTGLAASRTGTLFNSFAVKLVGNMGKIEKATGFAADAFKEKLSKDATGALLEMLESFAKIEDSVKRLDAIGQVFGPNQAKAILPLVNNLDALRVNLDTSREATEKNVSLSIAYEKASQGLAAAQGRLANVVQAARVEIGNQFLPVLTGVANKLPVVVEAMKRFVLSLNLGDRVGSVVALLSLLIKAATKTDGAVRLLRAGFDVMVGGIAGVVVGLASILNPMLGIATAAGLLTAKLALNSEAVKEEQKALSGMADATPELVSSLQSLSGALGINQDQLNQSALRLGKLGGDMSVFIRTLEETSNFQLAWNKALEASAVTIPKNVSATQALSGALQDSAVVTDAATKRTQAREKAVREMAAADKFAADVAQGSLHGTAGDVRLALGETVALRARNADAILNNQRALEGFALAQATSVVQARRQLEGLIALGNQHTKASKTRAENTKSIDKNAAARRRATLEDKLALEASRRATKVEVESLKLRQERIKAFASSTKASFELATATVKARAEEIKAVMESLGRATESVTGLMTEGWSDFVNAVQNPFETGSRDIIEAFRRQEQTQAALIRQQLELAREQTLAVRQARQRQAQGLATDFTITVDGTDGAIRELVQQVMEELILKFQQEGGLLCGLGA